MSTIFRFRERVGLKPPSSSTAGERHGHSLSFRSLFSSRPTSTTTSETAQNTKRFRKKTIGMKQASSPSAAMRSYDDVVIALLNQGADVKTAVEMDVPEDIIARSGKGMDYLHAQLLPPQLQPRTGAHSQDTPPSLPKRPTHNAAPTVPLETEEQIVEAMLEGVPLSVIAMSEMGRNILERNGLSGTESASPFELHPAARPDSLAAVASGDTSLAHYEGLLEAYGRPRARVDTLPPASPGSMAESRYDEVDDAPDLVFDTAYESDTASTHGPSTPVSPIETRASLAAPFETMIDDLDKALKGWGSLPPVRSLPDMPDPDMLVESLSVKPPPVPPKPSDLKT